MTKIANEDEFSRSVEGQLVKGKGDATWLRGHSDNGTRLLGLDSKSEVMHAKISIFLDLRNGARDSGFLGGQIFSLFGVRSTSN